VVKRDQLRSVETYAGTLLHETGHALSGAEDVSSEFEDALTGELGTIAKGVVPARARPRGPL
jgi:hypothetical protein